MQVDPKLILPTYGNISVPYPFTPFGRELDRVLKETGAKLTYSGFSDDSQRELPLHLTLERIYGRDDTDSTVTLTRKLEHPCLPGTPFSTDEVTWYNDKAYVDLGALLKAFSDPEGGFNTIDLKSGDEKSGDEIIRVNFSTDLDSWNPTDFRVENKPLRFRQVRCRNYTAEDVIRYALMFIHNRKLPQDYAVENIKSFPILKERRR